MNEEQEIENLQKEENEIWEQLIFLYPSDKRRVTRLIEVNIELEKLSN